MVTLENKSDRREQTEAENLLALGIITQGLSHRLANHLNTISLNSELSVEVLKSSGDSELLEETLSTIARVAKTAGALVHAVNEFAHPGFGANEGTDTTPGKLFAAAEDLLNLKTKSFDLTYAFSKEDCALNVQANSFAVSVVLACLIHTAIVSGESSLDVTVDRQPGTLDVQLRASQCCWTTAEGLGAQVLPFARRVLVEQGGGLQLDNSILSIRLQRGDTV